MTERAERPDKPLRFLLFDLDGTLVETLTDIAASVNHTMKTLGLPILSKEKVRSNVGKGVDHLMERSLGPRGAGHAEEGMRIFREHYREHCLDASHPLPGTMECLERFSDRRLAIASNKPEKYIHLILESFGMDRFFEMVFGGDTVEEMKPSPLMLHTALKSFRCRPSEGIMVGDMPVDIETGRAAGIFTVAVTSGFADRDQLEAQSPDMILDDLRQIEEFFC